MSPWICGGRLLLLVLGMRLGGAWSEAFAAAAAAAPVAEKVEYGAVEALFRKHCLDCHAVQEPEGGLVMETHAALLRGGKSGAALVPGKSGESLLMVAVETGLERDGRRRLMPPGKREKLKPDEIAVLRRWIDAGAPGPAPGAGLGGSGLAADAAEAGRLGAERARALVVPRIVPTVPSPRSIRAAAYSASLKLVALGRPGEVELVSPETRAVVRRLEGVRGAVTALSFSADGQTLAVAAGEPGLFGEATLWKAATGERLRVLEGHRDSLHAIALAPDGRRLATGSYDQKIQLWDTASGALAQTLSAHNAGILGLAFRPDGMVLASASGDRTVKLWQAGTGRRLETLGQPTREVMALGWSPDGKRLAAGGGDNRLRVWDVSAGAAETTNPLRATKYAHDGGVLAVVWSPDGRTVATSAEDRTIKLWAADADPVVERRVLESQPDLAPALVFVGGDGGRLLAGRMDGSWEMYGLGDGRRVAMPAPGLRRVAPRGLTVGRETEVTLWGTNLMGVTQVVTSQALLRVARWAVSADGARAGGAGGAAAAGAGSSTGAVVTVSLVAEAGLPFGAHDLWVRGAGGESGRVRVYADVYPLVGERAVAGVLAMPAAVWGGLERAGEMDAFRFRAEAGGTAVADLAVRGIGSKLQNGALSVHDAGGGLLAEAAGFDGGDRRVAFPVEAGGEYEVRVGDQMLQASLEHEYRLTVGRLPMVTGVFPLGVGTQAVTSVRVLGHNLGSNAVVDVRSVGEGVIDVPLDRERLRLDRTFQVVVSGAPQVAEREPNDRVDVATAVPVPGVAHGRLERVGDVDLFRFEARRGQVLIVETDAARRGSPADTRIELMRAADGKPVPRLLLQAVRNTAINFRSVDANGSGMRLDHYEEMELNQYLYLNGDVMRLFRMPQGPDSDMMMYTVGGLRRAWFGTTAVAHALDEAGYIVEPHPLGARLVPNGLPVFTVNEENDDDGERRLGVDARVRFEVPADGAYVARVSESRGHGGEAYGYRLVLREAQPDFVLTVSGANPTVPAGSGQSFTVTAERRDGFEGEIRVEAIGVPPGFLVSTPLVIEAGHAEVQGTVFALPPASAPAVAGAPAVATDDPAGLGPVTLTASAVMGGKAVRREGLSLGRLKRGLAPRVQVGLEADDGRPETGARPYDPAVGAAAGRVEPLELVLAPGGEVAAWLKIRRNGHGDLVTFFAEGLPHGVIVADIGLSGVLIPKGGSERRIVLSAERWVAPQERWFHLVEQQAGRQTTRPVRLIVRR